jgi:hypothetical protein
MYLRYLIQTITIIVALLALYPLVIVAPLTLYLLVATAAPPPGSIGEYAKWYENAQTPYCSSCCGKADGHPVLAKRDEHLPLGWAVMLDGKNGVMVPDGVRATRYSQGQPVELYEPHSEGRAVVWIAGGEVICFSPPVPRW